MGNAGWKGFSAINSNFAAEMNVDRRAREMGWDDSYGTFRSARQMMQHMTNAGAKELGSAHGLALETMSGVEQRNPLAYRRLSEFCAAIPQEQFMHKGCDRWLIRSLMKDRLPAEILGSPRGRPAADWHLRMTRDLDRYRLDIDRMAADPDLARRFDVPRIRKVLDSWPDRTPLSRDDHPDYLLAMVGIGRAITASRFINWVNGKND
jgi:asparagine synthase (glutamine-hydrolysing)